MFLTVSSCSTMYQTFKFSLLHVIVTQSTRYCLPAVGKLFFFCPLWACCVSGAIVYLDCGVRTSVTWRKSANCSHLLNLMTMLVGLTALWITCWDGDAKDVQNTMCSKVHCDKSKKQVTGRQFTPVDCC